MEDLPTWNDTPETCEWQTSKEELAKTLNSWEGQYIEGASRQERIDILFEKALAAKERGDMEAFRDYMDQIRNLNDDDVLTKPTERD